MIDIKSEKLIRLSDIPDLPWLPTRRRGSKLHRNTVGKWATRGMRGIVLETILAGGSLCTTEAALLRFFERLKIPGGTSISATPSQHRKSIERAEAALAADGL